MNKFAFVVATLAMTACTVFKVVEVDPKTGYFPTRNKAKVIANTPIDLDSKKSLLVAANSDFEQGLLKNIAYFDEVITWDELQKRIIAANLTDKIPSVSDRIGVFNAAKYYKPYIFLRIEFKGEGQEQYARLALTDPLTMEDYFLTETHLDHTWAGVNDQNNWYPMYNALIDYIKDNSKSYRKMSHNPAFNTDLRVAARPSAG
jgi:hypothetical protein